MARFRAKVTLLVTLEAAPDIVARALTEEWQRQFYPFDTEAEVLEHLIYNLVLQRQRLSSLDGWADCADTAVRVVDLRMLDRDDP